MATTATCECDATNQMADQTARAGCQHLTLFHNTNQIKKKTISLISLEMFSLVEWTQK